MIKISKIEEIIEDAKNGKMFLLVDSEDRENEGDLIIPAQKSTPEAISFMAKHGRGLICLCLTEERVKKLKLPLMNPNNWAGCGKSTLTRTILGLQRPEAGYINFDGKKISKSDGSFKKNVQVVFQDPYGSFNPRHKIGRLIAESFFALGELAPTQTEQRIIIEEMLEEVGLPSESTEKYIHEFSGGQRQRIAIARALVTKPKLVIFDEAVSALDVSIKSQILKLISDLTERHNLSYLFISHDLKVIENITEKCLVMKSGKIVERGPTKQILCDPKNEYTLSLINAAPKFPDFLHA